ncbi:hypothetical protein ASG68_06685 [Rhizobium sp. Leaf453]|nr:hypothetical protein ASG50_10340 [Rhizobium sp. Leaf386]KQS94422.1 hypothetical protein ASG42_06950 [Rhizobium sp. Leaf391]KQU01427.1 hypothetical protein ASG68_06685 [Rhizobium sp. Leaf453]
MWNSGSAFRSGGVRWPVSRHLPPMAGSNRNFTKELEPMLDIVLIGIGILFFALSFAYTKACDRL